MLRRLRCQITAHNNVPCTLKPSKLCGHRRWARSDAADRAGEGGSSLTLCVCEIPFQFFARAFVQSPHTDAQQPWVCCWLLGTSYSCNTQMPTCVCNAEHTSAQITILLRFATTCAETAAQPTQQQRERERQRMFLFL